MKFGFKYYEGLTLLKKIKQLNIFIKFDLKTVLFYQILDYQRIL